VGKIEQVCSSPQHTLGKPVQGSIRLVAGLGVEGDAHFGVTVKHRSRVRRDPSQPNLRQVHLIAAELHDELAAKGIPVGPGAMGENITTRGIDLLNLPVDTLLHIGPDAEVMVTGLRNPCVQLDSIHRGLMAATLARGNDGELVRKAGVMGVVVRGGVARAGDPIVAQLPPPPHRRLDRV
jgi:MOSC domain-containing protein YiiM